MAKFDLKFIDSEDDCSISCSYSEEHKEININGYDGNVCLFQIFLDKSTAIKFAKTLRTEINKIKE